MRDGAPFPGKQSVPIDITQADMGGVLLSQMRFAGEAELLQQTHRRRVAHVNLSGELARASLKKVGDQRGGAFTGYALPLPFHDGDVADLFDPRRIGFGGLGHGDEAPRYALRVFGDPGLARPTWLGEPRPQVLFRRKGRARQISALVIVRKRRKQRPCVRPLKWPHGKARRRQYRSVSHVTRYLGLYSKPQGRPPARSGSAGQDWPEDV